MCAAESPMKSRLIKTDPIDVWTVREKLALACGVQKSGDQNWYSVSRAMKQFGDEKQPHDWYSQKNCAQQYNVLLDQAQNEMPKRKRGERGEETAQDVIVRKLTQERIEELRKVVAEDKQRLSNIREEVALVNSSNPSEDLLRKIWARMKEEENQSEIDKLKHQEWLLEREKKFAAAKIASRTSRTVRPLSISAPATPAPAKADVEGEKGEQLVVEVGEGGPNVGLDAQITAPTATTSTPLASPLLTSLLKSPTAANKSPIGSRDSSSSPTKQSAVSQPFFTPNAATSAARQLPLSSGTPSSSPVKAVAGDASPIKSPGRQSPAAALSSSPTLSKLLEASQSSPTKTPGIVDQESGKEKSTTGESLVVQLSPVKTEAGATRTEREAESGKREEEPITQSEVTMEIKQELMDKDEESAVEDVVAGGKSGADGDTSDTTTSDLKTPQTRKRRTKATPISIPSPAVSTPTATRRSGRVRAIKRDEDSLPPTPTALTPAVSVASTEATTKKVTSADDTTDASISEESMEATQLVSKPVQSKTPSVSDSIPNSPASTIQPDDVESVRDFKRWQKSILILWRQISTHKHAGLFMAPVTNSDAEGYTDVVKRPMDLVTIKKRIENQSSENAIRTTMEFQRDVMLMFQNAMMYNKREHEVHKFAHEMQKEFMDSMEDFIATQKQHESVPGQASEMPDVVPVPVPKSRPGRERRSLLIPSGEPKDVGSESASRRKSRTSTDTDPGASGTPATGAKTRKGWKKT